MTAITADQRGFALDSPIDIGAFQTNPLLVNTSADTFATAPGELDLRQAMNVANVVTGDPTIAFDASLAGETITLVNVDTSAANVYGNTALVDDGADITIDGSGAPGLVISGNDTLRPFAVTSTASLTLEDLTIGDGLAQGFAGGFTYTGGGGGGGGGMGGAVYDDGGAFTAEGVTFTNNQAVGGVGGAATVSGPAGGGGGLDGAGRGGARVGRAVPTAVGTPALTRPVGPAGLVAAAVAAVPRAPDGSAVPAGSVAAVAAAAVVTTAPPAAGGTALGDLGGSGGYGGGSDGGGGGGGGAGLGGGIFSNGGTLSLVNDTFTVNSATGGLGGASTSKPAAPAPASAAPSSPSTAH